MSGLDGSAAARFSGLGQITEYVVSACRVIGIRPGGRVPPATSLWAEVDSLLLAAVRLAGNDGIDKTRLRAVVPVGRVLINDGLARLQADGLVSRGLEKRPNRQGRVVDQVVWRVGDGKRRAVGPVKKVLPVTVWRETAPYQQPVRAVALSAEAYEGPATVEWTVAGEVRRVEVECRAVARPGGASGLHRGWEGELVDRVGLLRSIAGRSGEAMLRTPGGVAEIRFVNRSERFPGIGQARLTLYFVGLGEAPL